MDFEQLANKFLNEDIFIPFLIAGSIVLGIAIQSVRACVQTFARERSRREIAAYIAEGSLSPEQGERLMRAGQRPDHA
jgi:hypothetical protein